jgi:hypothetical protein
MSKRGHGALFWLCCDAHLDDLPIAGRRARARHSSDSLLCRHEMRDTGLGQRPSTAAVRADNCCIRGLGRKLDLGREGRADAQRVVTGECLRERRRNAVYCSSCSTRSKE